MSYRSLTKHEVQDPRHNLSTVPFLVVLIQRQNELSNLESDERFTVTNQMVLKFLI